MTVLVDESTSASSGNNAPEGAIAFESRGWSAAGESCGPKIAALASLGSLPPPAPIPSVAYLSRGNALVIAGESPERARQAASDLASTLHVTLLERTRGASLENVATWSGSIDSLSGHLGEFTASIAGLRKDAGEAATKPATARFDLVLDFGSQAAFDMRTPPQGYFRAVADAGEMGRILAELREAVGEFEKPRYFSYRESLCAHSRSQIEGCNACIEVCSTRAIRPAGDKVAVDPHLCMGCGACATVCPSGAMGYQFPRPEDRGAQLRQLLSSYRGAGGGDACVVFHDTWAGRGLLADAAAGGSGLPARALPLPTWHVASIGPDILLAAIAYGASQVVVLAAQTEDAVYVEALREQMAIAEAILHGLGYEGRHFEIVQVGRAEDVAPAFAGLDAGVAVSTPAGFALSNDKRTAIEFAVEHLLKHAPRRVEAIPLPEGAPFGQVSVDATRCTMCLSCVGACPSSAIMDGVDQPLLKFVERNCVQCGLCAATCPEDAITLEPRLLLTPAAREARVLNQTLPFHCVRCQKPFGTKQMVEAMMGRLAGHSMFAGGQALRRLQMCADCRVVDMMESKDEASVLGLRGGA